MSVLGGQGLARVVEKLCWGGLWGTKVLLGAPPKLSQAGGRQAHGYWEGVEPTVREAGVRRKSEASWKGNWQSTGEAYSPEFGVNWATWSSHVSSGRKAGQMELAGCGSGRWGVRGNWDLSA